MGRNKPNQEMKPSINFIHRESLICTWELDEWDKTHWRHPYSQLHKPLTPNEVEQLLDGEGDLISMSQLKTQ